MADQLDYRFGDMQSTNSAVQQRLNEFRGTLEDFKNTYLKLAGNWGGAASDGAGQVATQLNQFGNETAEVVNRFLNELTKHLEDSMHTEKSNTGLFTG